MRKSELRELLIDYRSIKAEIDPNASPSGDFYQRQNYLRNCQIKLELRHKAETIVEKLLGTIK